MDSAGRSFASSLVPRLRPVIHTTDRSASPVSSPFRTSDGGTHFVPASSHQRQRRNGYKTDYRGKSRDVDRLRLASGREGTVYPGSRGRSSHCNSLGTASDNYMETGYTLTNPPSLAQHDLDHTEPRHAHRRRGSADSRCRPVSALSMADLGAKSFDARERGPPPSTRGRDKLPSRSTTFFDLPPRARGEMAQELDSRSSRKSRPVSMYQERESPRIHREGTYSSRESEARDRAPRENIHPNNRYDEDDDDDKNSEPPRSSEKYGHSDRKDHKGRESLAATLGLAAAGALHLTAAAQGKDHERERERDREDRDEPSRRPRDDSDEERRRRRRTEERVSTAAELDNRNTKTYTREGGSESPPRERDPLPSGEYDGASPKVRHRSTSQSPPREPRSSPSLSDGRARREHNTVPERTKEETPMSRTTSHCGSTKVPDHSSSSENEGRSSRKELPPPPPTSTAAFNPKDTSDLRALKALMSRQEESKDTRRPAGGANPSINTRERDYDSREDDRGRRDLRLIDETQPPSQLREPQQHQIRVVSPPRETPDAKAEEKPVKGILRPPREKFPEDPEHIREGVAPLKDAKKEGVPPDARWTQISRALVNPEALELGKERYEERQDRVIVLRVLSKDEIEQYAVVTEAIRAEREEKVKEHQRRRRAQRRERHERHSKERAEHRRSSRRRREEDSESDTTEEDDRDNDHVRSVEDSDTSRPKRITFDENSMMSGGLGDLKENSNAPGTYTGYTRNPPPR